MNICAIVCEYNPFHKGHQYHLEESRRQLGEETVMVGVMSGDYVQRGEAAVFSKFARAEAACRCGMNLMVELPLPWALSSAEGFAAGAVAILEKCSWAPRSGALMREELEKLKSMTIRDEGLTLSSSLHSQNLSDLDAMADAIAASVLK